MVKNFPPVNKDRGPQVCFDVLLVQGLKLLLIITETFSPTSKTCLAGSAFLRSERILGVSYLFLYDKLWVHLHDFNPSFIDDRVNRLIVHGGR